MSNISVIASAVKEGLELWKTYIATRQEAYERKMDKKQRKAIEYAERFILHYYGNEENKDKELDKLQKKFFKYN